jgi:uncharacterized membrane protein
MFSLCSGVTVKISVQTLLLAGVIALLCLVSGIIGGALTRNFGTSSYTLSYADFISIMLTAISLLMTLLAIFFGVLGVIGWNAISGGVRQRTKDFLEDGFKEGNALHDMLRRRVEEAMYEGVEAMNEGDGNDDVGQDR